MRSPGQGVRPGPGAHGRLGLGRLGCQPPTLSSHRHGAGCWAGAQRRYCRTRTGIKSQEVTRGWGRVALRDPWHERGSGEG